MARPISTQEVPSLPPPRRAASALMIGVTGVGAALLLGALVLWLRYGTAVFFEMIVSGIARCL